MLWQFCWKPGFTSSFLADGTYSEFLVVLTTMAICLTTAAKKVLKLDQSHDKSVLQPPWVTTMIGRFHHSHNSKTICNPIKSGMARHSYTFPYNVGKNQQSMKKTSTSFKTINYLSGRVINFFFILHLVLIIVDQDISIWSFDFKHFSIFLS